MTKFVKPIITKYREICLQRMALLLFEEITIKKTNVPWKSKTQLVGLAKFLNGIPYIYHKFKYTIATITIKFKGQKLVCGDKVAYWNSDQAISKYF